MDLLTSTVEIPFWALLLLLVPPICLLFYFWWSSGRTRTLRSLLFLFGWSLATLASTGALPNKITVSVDAPTQGIKGFLLFEGGSDRWLFGVAILIGFVFSVTLVAFMEEGKRDAAAAKGETIGAGAPGSAGPS